MLRVIVDVDTAWQVRVSTAAGALGVGHAIETFDIDGRRLPMVPAARHTATGERHDALCAGDREAAAGLLKRLRIGQPELTDGITYGRWLFECLLAPVWSDILTALASETGLELALRWPVSEGDLHRLVWEAMRDRDGHFLAGLPQVTVAITRLVASTVTEVQPIEGTPRVLFATGRKLADPTIRPGAMYMGLLQSMDLAGICRARARHGVSVDTLTSVCTTYRPDVVHLVAHGQIDRGRGVLLLDDGHGGQFAADATTLYTAMSAVRVPTAVALSACNTASVGESGPADPTDAGPLAAQLVAAGVPIVSAMSGEVSEPACRLYTRRLVEAVHCGASFVEASAHGRRAALLNRSDPASLDWALPALYVAERLDPAARLVEDKVGEQVGNIASALGLRDNPLFVGRAEILEAADLLVDGKAGVLGILAENEIRGLGATRVLKEIGWRVLRDGHVPLMPGPYGPRQGPTAGRPLIAEILKAMVLFVQSFDLEPFQLNTLRLDGAAPLDLTGDSPALVRSAIRAAIDRFGTAQAPMDIASVADLLAEDLGRLCDAAAAWGPPFGRHTRAVLLCDDAHDWGVPVAGAGGSPTAVGALIAMLDGYGLGTPQRPVPVVLAGSKTEGAGAELRTWSANSNSGYLVKDLKPFDDDDMMLGWQWVLLHPAMGPARQRYGPTVHTVRPASMEDYRSALYEYVGDHPGRGSREVYRLPRGNPNYFHTGNDEQAWRTYTDQYPEAAR